MEIQQAIKNNAEDLQTFIREMNLWEKEMKRKEESLLASPVPEQNQVLSYTVHKSDNLNYLEPSTRTCEVG